MNQEHFDENKVKRDELGRFAEKTALEISNTLKKHLINHEYIETTNGKVSYNALTRKQWRLWYEEQTQREKSYLLGKYELRRFVEIDGIYVLTNGDFATPVVEAVYKFSDLKEKQDIKELMEKYYGRE